MNAYKLFKASTFILFLQSMYVWFTWSIPLSIVYALSLLSFYNFYRCCRPKLVLRSKVFPLLLATVFIYQCLRVNYGFTNWVSTFLLYLNFIHYFRLPDEILGDLLKTITKWLSILLIPSIILFLLVLITHVKSPFLLDYYEDAYGIFYNYIFYVVTKGGSVRFNGPFVEPGYLGMIIAFLLYANNYDFKRWYIKFLLICGLMTLSLAAYVLIFIGWLLNYSILKKRFLAVLFFVAIVCGVFVNVSSDSLLGEHIFSRLEKNEDTGISGNNRVTADAYVYYEQMFESFQWLVGYGGTLDDDRVRGSGVVFYMLHYGAFGVFLWFLVYCSLIGKAPDKKNAICFLFLVIMSALQRFYPYWFSWIFVYSSSIFTIGSVKCEKYGKI